MGVLEEALELGQGSLNPVSPQMNLGANVRGCWPHLDGDATAARSGRLLHASDLSRPHTGAQAAEHDLEFAALVERFDDLTRLVEPVEIDEVAS